MRNIRIFYITLFTLFTQLFVVAQPHSSTPETIKITGDWAFPPYEFINDKGDPDGFIIDLLKEVMKDLQLDYQITLTHFPDAVKALETSKADLITGLIYSNVKNKEYEFSMAHSFVYPSIVCHKNSNIRRPEDLNGKKVILQDDRIMETIIDEKGIKCKAFFYNNMNDVLSALSQDTSSVALCGQRTANYLINKRRLHNLEVRPLRVEPLEYCFAATKKNEFLIHKINESIAKLKSNGVYQRLYNKWLIIPEESRISGTIYLTIGILTVLLLLSILFIIFVRFRIRKATKQIREINEELQLSLSKYHAIFDSIMVGVEYYDADGLLVNVNDKMLEIFGIPTKKEILDRKISWRDNPNLTDTDRINSSNGESWTTILEYNFDKIKSEGYYNTTKSGIRKIEIKIAQIKEKTGKIRAMIVTSADITDNAWLNKKYESLFRQNNAILKALPVGIEIYDKNGCQQFINEADAQIFGVENIEELLKQKICFYDNPNISDELKEKLRKGEDIDIEIKFDFDNIADKGFYDTQHKGFKIIKGKSRVVRNDKGNIENYIFLLSDVTEKYLYEKKLQENTIKWEHMYLEKQTVFDSLPVGIVIYDKEGKRRTLNQAIKNLYNISDIESYIAQRPSFYEDPEIPEKYKEIFRMGKDYEIVTEYNPEAESTIKYFPTGTSLENKVMNIRIKSIRDKNDNLQSHLVIINDITKEFRYKQELAEKNIQNELILNNNISGLVYLNTDLIVQWENVSHVFGKNNMHLYAKGSVCYKNFGNTSPCANCPVVKSITSRQKESQEYQNPNGTIIDAISIPIVSDNEVKGIVLRLDDITERKNLYRELKDARNKAEASNRLLSEIINRMPNAIFIKDVTDNYRYIIANKTLCQSFAMPEEDIIGKTDYEIFSPEEAEKFRQDDERSVTANILQNISEETCINGKTIYWQTSKLPFNSLDGRKLLIAVSIDITEIKKTNQALTIERQRAEQSDKLKSAFLANMSHEIRTPLNAIVGFSELLMEEQDETNKAEYYKIISFNNELLLRLISDILDLSKIESGMIELKFETFDLTLLFEETYQTFLQRIDRSQIELIKNDPYKKCIVTLDKNRISQIGINFLTNAIKYTPKGSITMGYEYQKGGICLWVKDSGIGISEENHQKVFGRFEKFDDFAQGTGLGLSICKAITDTFKGKIGFHSEEGKGSTFWVWIPCEAQIEEQTGNRENQEIKYVTPHQETNNMIRNQLDILIAEDNDSNYLLIKNILKGHKLTRTVDGAETVKTAKEKRYDIILMDMKMPVMGGLEATKEIRKFDTAIPIIAVTANSFETDRANALAAGCSEFIAKPLKKDILINTMDKLLIIRK